MADETTTVDAPETGITTETTDPTTENAGTADSIENTDAPEGADTKVVPPPPPPPPSDDEILAMLKERGVEVASLEDLKPKVVPTPEEVNAVEVSKDRQLLEKHIERVKNNPKVSESEKANPIKAFTEIKEILKANPKDLKLALETQSILDAGYSQQEADVIIKSRYSLYTDDEIEEMDEDEQERAKKSRDYFSKKLEEDGSPYIEKASNYLKALQDEIDAEIYVKTVDAAIAASVVEKGKSFPRKVSFELKELGEKLGLKSIELDLDETAINESLAVLSNKESRESLLLNKDGSEKADYVFELLAQVKSIPKLIEQAVILAAKSQADVLSRAMPNDLRTLFNNPIGDKTANGRKISETGVIAGSMAVKN
jgi:hypothetical protein